MRGTRRTLFLLLSLAALVSACGRGSQAAVAGATADSVVARAEDDPRMIYGVPAAENVRVVPVEIDVVNLPPGWSGMKVAALSDFHLGMWPDNERVAAAAVRKAIEARPDVFVLLGDYVGRGGNLAALDRVLAPLRGRPVYAVLGDEDMVDNPQEPDTVLQLTVAALERNGVRVLRNTRAAFGRGGDTAYIGGLEPYVARKADWRRAEIYGGLPGGESTPLLLSHMPVASVTLPTEKYQAVLAGHTFCGTVEVPRTPRLAWFNTEILPGTPDPGRTRIYRVRGSTLFITCGVGFSFVPVRLGSPPEVALVTLRGLGAVKRDTTTSEANVDSLIQFYQQGDTTGTDTTGG
jgi:predicted MPP superfamily phosphohydrolase